MAKRENDGDEFSVDTDVGRLAVRVVGSGDPVVLWHSMFVDSHSWDRLIPELGERALFLIDGPSSGRSEPLSAAADISACVRAAVTVVDEVRRRTGVSAIDWVGNAWGGHVGMELAASRPDLIRSLVAISAPTFPIPAALRRKVHLLLPLYRLIGPRGPVRAAIEETIFTDRTRSHDRDAVAILDASLASSGRAMVPAVRTAIVNRTDLSWAAVQITCPVLLVATDDRGEWTGTQAQEAADGMIDATVVSIAQARVIPALEQPGATGDAITGFWSEIASDGRRRA